MVAVEEVVAMVAARGCDGRGKPNTFLVGGAFVLGESKPFLGDL